MMNSADVRVYLTQFCPYCRMAVALLSRKGVHFTQVDCAGRNDVREWIANASGQGTVPQIFINGKAIGGYSELSTLERSGKLDELLAERPPTDLPEWPE